MIASRRTNDRTGMSMAEVLVALFLLALGTIAILTMFPLGMYKMGQALKDDRTSQSAQQADAFMRMYWRTHVVENQFASVTGSALYEPMVPAFDFPDSQPGLPAATPLAIGNAPAGRLPNITGVNGPSYPVFVDPMGYFPHWNTLNASTYQMQYWVGRNAVGPTELSGVYPRRSLNMLLTQLPGASHRACSLMDGFGFAENGTPSGSAPGIVDRELRYNWMWILQRPDNSVPNTANMTVVVFDKRAFQYAPQKAEEVFSSGATPADTIWMHPLFTTIQIPVSRGVPAVQKGGWIMDATYIPAGATAPFGMRHAIFYRVVSVTDNPNNTMIANGVPTVVPTTDIELQTPIRRLDGGTGPYAGTLIHFAGVSEVFERPNLTPYDW